MLAMSSSIDNEDLGPPQSFEDAGKRFKRFRSRRTQKNSSSSSSFPGSGGLPSLTNGSVSTMSSSLSLDRSPSVPPPTPLLPMTHPDLVGRNQNVERLKELLFLRDLQLGFLPDDYEVEFKSCFQRLGEDEGFAWKCCKLALESRNEELVRTLLDHLQVDR